MSLTQSHGERRPRPRFVVPETGAFFDSRESYRGEFRTYSHFNYLRPGLIARLKRRRFDIALRLANTNLGRGAALDFGCANGVFLPSLAQACPLAVGIDRETGAIATAQTVVTDLDLRNVSVLCSAQYPDGIPPAAALRGAPFRTIFLLETLEHVGEPGNLVPVQCAFVRKLFALLDPDGQMVVSVPRMVGLGFLVKHVARQMLRLPGNAIAWREALRAGFLFDTTALARHWAGGHEGFNDLALERALGREFTLRRRVTMFSRFWVLTNNRPRPT